MARGCCACLAALPVALMATTLWLWLHPPPEAESLSVAASSTATRWTLVVPRRGRLHKRHEAGFAAVGRHLVLLGGRGIAAVDVYSPRSNDWVSGAPLPRELHHFQPVAWEGKLLLPGAMTGQYPHESPVHRIPVFDPSPEADEPWGEGAAVPAGRRRGSCGAAIVGGMLYLVGGITDGHWNGSVAWLDALDLATGQWRQLPDAPRARDHFHAAAIDGGRAGASCVSPPLPNSSRVPQAGCTPLRGGAPRWLQTKSSTSPSARWTSTTR